MKTVSTMTPAPVGPGRKDFTFWLQTLATAFVLVVALGVATDALSPEWQSSTDENQRMSMSRMASILQQTPDPLQRDSMCLPLSGLGRQLDAQIPANARVFLNNMLGHTNQTHLGYFYFLNYYLAPREVALSVGSPAKFTAEGFEGRAPESPEELAKAGYDLEINFDSGQLKYQPLNPALRPRDPKEVVHAFPASDAWLAFLLPLATALAGARLVRWLFPDLTGVLSAGEWLACGLGIGALVLTQLTLGLRLAGLRLESPLLLGVAVWAAVEVFLLFRGGFKLPKFNSSYLWWLLLLPLAHLFLCLFRLAGLEGLREFDAIAFWALKGKLFHLFAGSELWPWFHNPTLGYAHLDYPLLAPMLHALTYGAIGHINEFVTKYWNQWMLLSLVLAVLGAARFPRQKPWLVAAAVTLMATLPQSLEFSRMEGATMPITFFAILGSLQFSLGLIENAPARLRLGLLLLIGATMVKFEGMLLLISWCGLLVFTRAGRSVLFPWKRLAIPVAAGFATWIPYVFFMLHKPVPHPESGWAGQMLHNLGTVLKAFPATLLANFSRRFLHNDFAAWTSPDNVHAVWNGHYVGWGSVYDTATLGLAWVCLALFLAGVLSRRHTQALVLNFLVFVGFGSAISLLLIASHCAPLDFSNVLNGGTSAVSGGRYLFPVMVAWFLSSIIAFVRPTQAAALQPATPHAPKKESEAPAKH
jgi:hypothetical protein